MLTHAYVRENLHYSIITGQFFWLKSPSPRIKIGAVLGYLNNDGYKMIGINAKDWRAHRLAWFWVTSEWPEKDIDHINGVRDANCWLNLREATRSQNLCNTKMRSDNSSGRKGVCWHKQAKKWRAYIMINKKEKYLGLFDNVESAYDARLKAEKEIHGNFARRL